MTAPKIKVLYIAGWDRSGSTLLDNLLGQLAGFFSVGEVRYVWDRGLIENRLCGCGASFQQCPTWRVIFDHAFGGSANIPVERALELRSRCDRLRYMFQPATAARRRVMQEYGIILERLFLGICSATHAEVIVDSSKAPSHGYLLQQLASLDLYLVHLTRDPRAVAFSWQRRKPLRELPGEYMRQISPLESSLMWDAVQLSTRWLGRQQPDRYLRLRYEDLMERPRESVARILRLFGRSPGNPPFVGERELLLRPGHGVSGNPARFETGIVTLRPDDEWKRKMISWQKLLVSVLTGSVSFRYGYPLLPPTE